MIEEQQKSKRLFGRRKGRPLRAGRALLMDTLLPRVRIMISSISPSPCGRVENASRFRGGVVGVSTQQSLSERMPPPPRKNCVLSTLPQGEGDLSPALAPRNDEGLNPFALFDFVPEAVRLEIGFGGGEHLAAQAAANPSVGFMGCEPFINGVAKLLTQVEAQDLKNVRVYPDDARVLLDALPDSCLAMCFVLYADPWPKNRHAERRFIGRENLDRLARVLTSGGQLRLATDVAGLAQWMREQANAHPSFVCLYDGPNAPADWVPTRYEQKGIAAGRTPTYLVYKRR